MTLIIEAFEETVSTGVEVEIRLQKNVTNLEKIDGRNVVGFCFVEDLPALTTQISTDVSEIFHANPFERWSLFHFINQELKKPKIMKENEV